MRTKSKRTPALEVRSQLLAAALRVLTRDGIRGLTVRAVAAEAGVAPMGVYNHFDGKEGLVVEVVRYGFHQIRDLARGAEGEPFERLLTSGRRYRQFALDNPTLYRLMFSGDLTDMRDVRSEAFAALVDVVALGQAAGIIRAGDPGSLTMHVWSALHGLVSLEVDGPGAPQPEADPAALFEDHLRFIVRGVAPD